MSGLFLMQMNLKKLFANNKNFVKQFIDFEEGRLSGKTTDFFCKNIAEPYIADIDTEISFTHIDIRDIEKLIKTENKQDDNKLIALYKLFSPEHLLKLPFANDSNNLNKGFYNELLFIIGLEETKEGNKKLIGRKSEGKRNAGSLIENVINILKYEDCLSQIDKSSKYGNPQEEQLFTIALELVISWINRILFLKLLEGQLLKYHNGDKNYEFLNIRRIPDYDALNKLFFQVLAVKENERNDIVRQKFGNIPFLNSSLFEPNDLEHKTIRISNLEDEYNLPVLSNTVLKDKTGKSLTGEINTLQYLFEFLNAYDFASEGSEEIQEENKTLINASVLGLIFEKINGYKDGSFFTPGFITMYMCHETIRKAVVQKFNEVKDWNCENIDDVYNKIEDKKEANKIINSLKICDPAVGSGHFLVSALNEIIAVKSDLKILLDRQGRTLRDYHIEVVNDELVITDDEGELFEYQPKNKESQRIQETLFHEKQTIIENCLFGVDINPNSVKICRLRLWIELLKNAYYKPGTNYTELETLPNIDINIKCGNSLISRYPLDADIKKALKQSKWSIESYRLAVMTYRNAESKEQKHEMVRLIDEIKSDFETEIVAKDKRVLRLNKLKGELFALTNQGNLFEQTKKEKTEWDKKIKKLTSVIQNLETELEDIKNNKIYENAFEWRFEFPEVLDDNGDFTGFDVVIGNPPYMVVASKIYTEYKTKNTSDLYCYFFEKGINILKEEGYLGLITSSLFIKGVKYDALRNLLLNYRIINIDIRGDGIFEDVQMPTAITFIQNIRTEKEYDWEDIFITNPIVKKMRINTIKLKSIAQLRRGLEIGKDKTSLSKTEEFPMLTGEDIDRYFFKINKYISKETHLKYKKEDKFFVRKRILIRETGAILTSIYLDCKLLSNRSLYSILIKKEGYYTKYILALLNSKLMQYFYQTSLKSDTNIFPKIRIIQVKELPIKVNNQTKQKIFIQKVDQILAAKKQNPNADTVMLEKEIDRMVYKLYGLTEDEIEIVENS